MELLTHYIALITEFYINNLGVFGALIVIIIGSFIPPVPDAVFFGLAANSFGLYIGIIISYIGTVIGASLVYWLSRWLGQIKWIKKILTEDQRIVFYVEKFKKIQLSTLSISLAIPFLPAVAIHVASGLVKMSYRKFLVALLIGKIALVLFWSYVGQSLVDGVQDPRGLILLFIIVGLVYIVSKYISKKYQLEE